VHEERARRDVEKLVLPPEAPGSGPDAMLCRLAEWAAGIVGAPRVLIAWEEPDEPWLYVAWWDRGEFRYTQEPPGAMDPLVPAKLAEASFLCKTVGAPRPAVLYRSGDGINRWRGAPLHPTLRARFDAQSVLSLNLVTDTLRGRLFFFDGHGMTMDDLVFAEVVSRHVAARLTHFHRLRGFADKTVLNERLRLARDLHDGALHSLAGVALELENLLQMPRFEPIAARRRVLEVQQSLLEEQRNIRQLIAQLRPEIRDGSRAEASLATRLDELARRLERQWGLRVECILDGLDSLPARRSSEVYLVVHEALINAARHASAATAWLEVAVRDGRVNIDVADDGRGFEFKGRYDHATLAALDLGPATLRERVTLLGGLLAIESTANGTRLEIALPAEAIVAA
jgi:signal transduction histidine kinase